MIDEPLIKTLVTTNTTFLSASHGQMLLDGIRSPSYLVHSSEHLSRVGDSFYSPAQDIQRKLQPLQDLVAFTVQAQGLQCLDAHISTHTVILKVFFFPFRSAFTGLARCLHTSSVSFPLLSSSWMFSSARFRACSSACSLCFRVYWSQRRARAIWEKAVWVGRRGTWTYSIPYRIDQTGTL